MLMFPYLSDTFTHHGQSIRGATIFKQALFAKSIDPLSLVGSSKEANSPFGTQDLPNWFLGSEHVRQSIDLLYTYKAITFFRQVKCTQWNGREAYTLEHASHPTFTLPRIHN